jgi:RNA polymerase sigma-70 factor (ECF subfamily)
VAASEPWPFFFLAGGSLDHRETRTLSGRTDVDNFSAMAALKLEAAGQAFLTTHWSVVWRARDKDSPDSAAAREHLCRTYWAPLYHYIRRDGQSPHDAQDLTQEFLSRFLHHEWLEHLTDQRGKFRSFLLTFLRHFLSDQCDRAQAQKRGGGQPVISIDAYEAEEREFNLPADGLSPDEIFDQRWARSVMHEAIRRLEREYGELGKRALFEQLKDLQPGEHGTRSYAQIGAALGLTEQAVKNARHTFNRRYAFLLRDEVAQTVADPGEVEAEVRHLMKVFAR